MNFIPLACGDCEHMPCRCDAPNNVDDLDLAWLPRLADHDSPPAQVVEMVAA